MYKVVWPELVRQDSRLRVRSPESRKLVAGEIDRVEALNKDGILERPEDSPLAADESQYRSDQRCVLLVISLVGGRRGD